tara:strand:- start:35 stop:838 length:804 start_codon:yes stop_codon:yes gene_type:complete
MGEMMSNTTNKFGNKIECNPKAKGYRYKVDGQGKKSVTTAIDAYIKLDLTRWVKRLRDEAMKEVMLEKKVPLDKINTFIDKVAEKAQKEEDWAKNIGTQLHEWIDYYLKGKKPSIPSTQPLKRMATDFIKFWKEQKFKVIESEMPLYSPRFDLCGTNDVIVTKDDWNGELGVLDWKTSKDYNFNHILQIEAYRRFIEETTEFKVPRLAIVNIPKEVGKKITMYEVPKDRTKQQVYFKSFRAMRYLANVESKFRKDISKWKKENKTNV